LESLKKDQTKVWPFSFYRKADKMQKKAYFIKILLRFFFYKTNFIKEFSIGVNP